MAIHEENTYVLTLSSLALLTGGAFLEGIGYAFDVQHLSYSLKEWTSLFYFVGGFCLGVGLLLSLPTMLMGVILCMRERRLYGWVGFLFVFWFFGAATTLLVAHDGAF